MAEGGKASSPPGSAGGLGGSGAPSSRPASSRPASSVPAAPPSSSSAASSQPALSQSGSATDPLIGRTISGRFKIASLIARGGMGRVYRAEQAPLGRICALKILTTTYEGEHDPEFHKRFFLEASIASKITHPNSVTIFDYGQTEDDIYYMAMEYLEGVTLHRAIRVAGHLTEARTAHIGRQVCRALREAHALGCIHRDLKPANIFLTEHGDEPDFVKVLDFGLVKDMLGEGKGEEQLTQTGLFMGSPKYMAPEQIRGEKVDVRTDIYSLGIILYEMLTGKVPFERATSLNTLMAQVNDRPPPLRETNPAADVSPEMEQLIFQCMAKDPNERAASMDVVLASLKRITGPGFGLTGEYRALGASASGSYNRAEPTPSRPLGSPASQAPPSAQSGSGAHSVDNPSVSVSMSGIPLTRPSVTPMLDSAGGGSITVGPKSLPPPDFRRQNGRNLLALGGGLAVAALVGFLALRGGGAPVAGDAAGNAGEPAATSAAPLPATAPPPPTALPPAAPKTISVHFVTEPPGASIKENGVELCAATPCDHGFPADMSLEHKVVISHGGYRPETRVLHGTDAELTVTLVAAKAWTPPPGSAPPRGTVAKPADSSGAPQGFKDIPY